MIADFQMSSSSKSPSCKHWIMELKEIKLTSLQVIIHLSNIADILFALSPATGEKDFIISTK